MSEFEPDSGHRASAEQIVRIVPSSQILYNLPQVSSQADGRAVPRAHASAAETVMSRTLLAAPSERMVARLADADPVQTS
jgi:hypothetical protein